MSNYILELYSLNHPKRLLVVYICIILGILFQILLTVYLFFSRNDYREKELIIHQYLNDQQSHFEYLRARENETKKFRHDIRAHIATMHSLYNENKFDILGSYLDDLEGQILNMNNRVSVGNDIADAVINRYVYEAVQSHININVTGHLPPICHLSAYDICTLFSNTLSNAIQAEKQTPFDEIDVVCKYDASYIYLLVENDYNFEPQKSFGHFISNKPNPADHGIGLQNVQDCVDRNNGTLEITTANKKFKVRIMLRNEH